MSGNIWVLVSFFRGSVLPVTQELLVLGRELADELGVGLDAVLLAHNPGDHTNELAGADRVIQVEHAQLETPSAEVGSHILTHLIREKQPQAVLVPLSNVSWDLLGLLPVELDAPFVNFCKDARVVDGKIQASCLMYGGKMQTLVTPKASPAIFAVLPGVRPVPASPPEPQPTVELIATSLPESLKVDFKSYLDPEAGDVDIAQQEVLIAVGRGIQNESNLEVAQELAELLNGAVCGSRPVIDQGWLPLSSQVGKSGVHVKPKLYLAAGISGAPEHVEGMKNAELIIAINTDPQAPIFSTAHYGIVGDAVDVLEALSESMGAKT